MTDFNFSLSDSNVSANNVKRFKPYTINEFNNISCEIKNGANWKAVELTFKGENGIHSEMLFFPKDSEDTKRRTYPGSNGHDMVFPSNWESFKQTIVHVLGMYSPDNFEKFKNYVETKVKTLDDFVNAFVTLIGKSKERKLYLKVVGKNVKGSIYASLPSSCAISDKGELYPKNFISETEDGLQFTTGELNKKKTYESASPTPMEDKDSDVDLGIDSVGSKGSEDLDWDSL